MAHTFFLLQTKSALKFGSEAPTKIYKSSMEKLSLIHHTSKEVSNFKGPNDYRLKMSKMIPSRGANSCIDMVNFKTNF